MLLSVVAICGDDILGRKYWQNDGYSEEEVEEKLNEMDQFPAQEERSHSPGISWWDHDRNQREEDIDETERYANSDALEHSPSRSMPSSSGSRRSDGPPQLGQQEDDDSKSGPDAIEGNLKLEA